MFKHYLPTENVEVNSAYLDQTASITVFTVCFSDKHFVNSIPENQPFHLGKRAHIGTGHWPEKDYFNPLKTNGMSHSYQLDQFISLLRDVGWYFSTFLKF